MGLYKVKLQSLQQKFCMNYEMRIQRGTLFEDGLKYSAWSEESRSSGRKHHK